MGASCVSCLFGSVEPVEQQGVFLIQRDG